ncbi:hypothetical protein GCM10008959_36270 [Deinococcus seoulensis]|uniref:Uncharacterized protein n=2 Tax=Deinococcus seoulensis TaxID=1837379 RepID=A0ABQ2RVK9_9DEIO|nr:hypothetical protein GCM10008959_36270 [Deinococcus seoulensis]
MARWIATQLQPAGQEGRAALLLSSWEEAFPDAPRPLEALKAEYLGWRAAAWALEQGSRVAPGEVESLVRGQRVRAGNSQERQLWRSRIVHLQPHGIFVRLPSRVPAWVLREGVRAGHLPTLLAPDQGEAPTPPSSPPPLMVALANKPGILIDRATRGAGGWNDVTLLYQEGQGDLSLNYFEENAGPEHLRQQLMTLDPRTSDVWRLLTAKALENDRDDLFAPITVRPEELARALGLKPHPKGGMRQKDLLHCTQSLFHLERLWLIMPDAKDPEEATRERVLAVMKRGRGRRVDGQVIPSSWTVVLGEWARYFPKRYAPIFRSLVELPANSATNLWAKQVGTEVTYWLRETAEDTSAVRSITVQTLLTRASLLPDVMDMRQNKNLNRAIERFEATLDLLRSLGVHDGWTYDPVSTQALDRQQGRPAFFETWLASQVVLKVPDVLLSALVEMTERNTPT